MLAQQNKGIPKFIPDQALESELTNFFLTINNPVLLNTTVTFDPDVVQQVIPYPFPNLYKGQQLIISGRYPESPGTLNMHLEGVAFNVPVSYDFQIPLSDTASISASVIPKIWAKQRIDALSLQYYLATTQEEKDGLQSDIDSISICYGVVSTAFTSFEDGSTTEVEETTPGPKISSFATPSPFTDGVIIHLSLDDIDLHNLSGQVELYSLTGQLVRRVKATIQEQDRSVLLEIHSLGDLPAGVYFCLIHVGDQTVTVRLVKA